LVVESRDAFTSITGCPRWFQYERLLVRAPSGTQSLGAHEQSFRICFHSGTSELLYWLNSREHIYIYICSHTHTHAYIYIYLFIYLSALDTSRNVYVRPYRFFQWLLLVSFATLPNAFKIFIRKVLTKRYAKMGE